MNNSRRLRATRAEEEWNLSGRTAWMAQGTETGRDSQGELLLRVVTYQGSDVHGAGLLSLKAFSLAWLFALEFVQIEFDFCCSHGIKPPRKTLSMQTKHRSPVQHLHRNARKLRKPAQRGVPETFTFTFVHHHHLRDGPAGRSSSFLSNSHARITRRLPAYPPPLPLSST